MPHTHMQFILTERNFQTHLAKPTSALVPYRIAAASISSSSKNSAASAQVQPHGAAPPSILPRQVPLPSQEGTKGIVQYALYVSC